MDNCKLLGRSVNFLSFDVRLPDLMAHAAGDFINAVDVDLGVVLVYKLHTRLTYLSSELGLDMNAD
jgi:hypothetical protein